MTQEYWPVRQTPQEYWPDTRGNVHSERAAGDRRNAERRESRAAALDEDIRAMPMEMRTVVPADGAGLSVGQKQRLLIARALARRPRVLLFDEATSALDNRAQAVGQASMTRITATRVVIAHRLSSIRDVDRIYVLDHGQIVETGTCEVPDRMGGAAARSRAREVGAGCRSVGSAAHGLRLLEEAVVGEHVDPARRVALDEEVLVVDARVGVGPVVAQDGEDHAQQLGGGGEDGALVAETAGEGSVMAAKLRELLVRTAPWAHSGSMAGKRRVALARAARVALAGAGVDTGGHAGAGAEIARLTKDPRSGPISARIVHTLPKSIPRYRLQQPQGRL